jgi:hypothetical protein
MACSTKADEYWLYTKSSNFRKIMTSRMAMAASKGCDAIYPDTICMRLISHALSQNS